jgi:signal peptidase I
MAFPLLVEKNCIFALGDNRNESKDSRHPDIGLIDKREILGKAIFLIIPGLGEGGNAAPRDFDRIGVVN